ncbi:MAG: DUF3072 domain-containing protein [Burkholderiales bacterium]
MRPRKDEPMTGGQRSYLKTLWEAQESNVSRSSEANRRTSTKDRSRLRAGKSARRFRLRLR